jgi:hypothetical protein
MRFEEIRLLEKTHPALVLHHLSRSLARVLLYVLLKFDQRGVPLLDTPLFQREEDNG